MYHGKSQLFTWPYYTRDITVDTDTCIVETDKLEMKWTGKLNSTESLKDEMMSFRCKLFKFHH